jgi:hypothetical protein
MDFGCSKDTVAQPARSAAKTKSADILRKLKSVISRSPIRRTVFVDIAGSLGVSVYCHSWVGELKTTSLAALSPQPRLPLQDITL